jgi:DNA-binding MarR family transcriptional regulator
MERLGYVEREANPTDGRAWRLQRTARGDEMLELSAAGFDRLRAEWVQALGATRVRALEADLSTMVAAAGGAKLGDLPGWLHEPTPRP